MAEVSDWLIDTDKRRNSGFCTIRKKNHHRPIGNLRRRTTMHRRKTNFVVPVKNSKKLMVVLHYPRMDYSPNIAFELSRNIRLFTVINGIPTERIAFIFKSINEEIYVPFSVSLHPRIESVESSQLRSTINLSTVGGVWIPSLSTVNSNEAKKKTKLSNTTN